MQLQFLGATETVTGSKYLLKANNKRILVDCGLFQGYKELRLRNWAPLPIDPSSIDAVVLTHAHIDHSGYLPLLVKKGFTGPIYATEATYDLCKILLPDSGYLHEEDARRANKYGYSKHHPALPLYTKQDAEISLKQFKKVDFGKAYSLLPEGTVTWYRAGHILGSAFIQFNVDNTTLLFSGDIGRLRDPIMKPSAIIQSSDYLVLESTYGNRIHEKIDPKDEIKKIVNQTVKRGGTILIPAFAVGRAQNLLYHLSRLKEAGDIPNIPVYLDSPMSINVTNLLCKHTKEHQLSPDESKKVCSTAIYVNTPEESQAIHFSSMPKIIISASGMATGGRVLHHIKALAPDHRNTILFSGFQAAETRGAKMLEGHKEVKMHGKLIPIRAKIENLSNTSAHADYEEILTWLEHFTNPPKKVFITHGEPAAALALKQHIESQLGWECYLPEYLEDVILS